MLKNKNGHYTAAANQANKYHVQNVNWIEISDTQGKADLQYISPLAKNVINNCLQIAKCGGNLRGN